MAYAEYRPPPALSELVKCFWTIFDDPSDEVQDVWPDACVELVFSTGNNFILRPDGTSKRLPEVVVLGIQTEILRVCTEGDVRLLGARMFPLGAGNWAPDKLDDLGATIRPLLMSGDGARAAQLLQSSLLEQPRLQDTLSAAIRKLYAEGGSTAVSELAAAQGVSSRQLQRAFAARFGISPKTLAKVVRFAQSWSRLLDRPGLSLAELALELGYTDQAHLSNEFRSFGKESPNSFRRKWAKTGVSRFSKTDSGRTP